MLKKLPKKLIKNFEEEGYMITLDNNTRDERWQANIAKHSSLGQDFSFYVDLGGNLADFREEIYDYYMSYDIDEEAALWIGPDGHGKNGAPYRLSDLLEDMKECEKFIYRAFEIVQDYISKKKIKEN